MGVVACRLYERVSTERQATEGFSLEAQHDRLVAFAKSQGWEIVGRYVDDGASAKSLERAEFQRMLAECKQGDYILVYKLDRLTRSSRDIEYLIELAEKRNIYFKSATEDINTSTSSGRFHLRLIVQFAQYEREQIAERSAMGKRKRVQSGYWPGGPAPYGYRLVDSDEVKNGRVLKSLDINPETAPTVVAIYEKYLAGTGVRQIAKWLNEQRIPTNFGKQWSAPIVSRTLRNPVYCGDGTVDRNSPSGRLGIGTFTRIPINVPPIISREMFDQTQKVLAYRTSTAPRLATGMFPLSGIGVCGNCGSKLHGFFEGNKAKGQRYREYRCANFAHGKPCGPKPFKCVSATKIEENLVRQIETWSVYSAYLDDYYATALREQQAKARTVETETKRLTKELTDSLTFIRRWDEKYERGRMTEEEHEEKTRPHRERVKEIRHRLSELEAEQPQVVDRVQMQQAMKAFVTAWRHLEPPEQKALLQSFVMIAQLRIVVYPDASVQLQPPS